MYQFLNMWIYIGQLIWLFLPAGCANMAASFFKWLPILNYPVDFNKTWKGKAILGPHKTWRGFILGFLAAVLMFYIQKANYSPDSIWYLYDYSQINVWLLGFLAGFGALAGDAVRSFFKRRRNIEPGEPWMPYDQVDWLIGAIILMSFYWELSWQSVVASIFLAIIIHPLVNYICYLTKLQKNKF